MKQAFKIAPLICGAILLLVLVTSCKLQPQDPPSATEDITPAISTPVNTSPTETVPAETTPTETTPAETTSTETEPEETTPEDNTPQEPTLCGDALSSYVIVYDEAASDYTIRAAEYIQDAILARTGIDLPIFSIGAADAENAHEIVVGETARAISGALNATTEGLEFAFLANEDHIAMEGDYFIIAAAAYYFVEIYIPSASFDTDVPQTVSVCTPIVKDAKNFILLIGDGMGINQTRLFDAYQNNPIADYSDGEDFFYGYLLPYIGEAKTNSLSGTTDSAAAGTALASGYKTKNQYVGKDGNLKDVPSLTELAAARGMATAVMSTEGQTGATPAAFSAHANSRYDSEVILAAQADLVAKYGTIIDCNYNVYTEAEMATLRAAITRTLTALSQDADGFFIMYEEAHIDKHCHNNDAQNAYLAMVRFNQAIALFMEYAFYNPNTVDRKSVV